MTDKKTNDNHLTTGSGFGTLPKRYQKECCWLKFVAQFFSIPFYICLCFLEMPLTELLIHIHTQFVVIINI